MSGPPEGYDSWNAFYAEDAAVRGETANLLDSIVSYLDRFLVMPAHTSVAVALWVLHTHAFDAADVTPYLEVTSAEKRSGKTLLLEILELLVARPVKAGGTTAAALVRAISQDNPPPTMLLDESDNTFKRDREFVATLMGALNDGFRRGGKTLVCLPPNWRPGYLPVFAPKAIAGIGRLPDTVQDRSIQVRMVRKTRAEAVERFRRRKVAAEAESLQQRAAAWAEACTELLRDAWPALPEELDARAQDIWEPLLAIGDLAGGGWPSKAREAAVGLSGAEARMPEEESVSVRLLADARRVFEQVDRYTTADFAAALAQLDESPWGDWYGKPITAQEVAKRLSQFGIRTNSVKIDREKKRGYRREWFADAWARYLPGEGGTSGTSGTRRSASETERTAGTGGTAQDGLKEEELDALALLESFRGGNGAAPSPDEQTEVERLAAKHADLFDTHPDTTGGDE